MFLKNTWYMAAIPSEIIDNKLHARTILNTKVVLFRKVDGSYAALEDRCAHRQLPLSKGILEDDTVRCLYHGLKYDSQGNCIEVPTQDNIPTSACVTRYPVVCSDNLIWIWMGDENTVNVDAIPKYPMCLSASYAGEMFHTPIACNYLAGIDNLMDISHAAFVHVRTLGSEGVVRTRPEVTSNEFEVVVRRNIQNEIASPLFKKMLQLEHIDRKQIVKYWPAGNTLVSSIASPAGSSGSNEYTIHTVSIITPETDTTSHIFVGMYRDFMVSNTELTSMITKQVYATVQEDKDVTEALQAHRIEGRDHVSIVLDQAPIESRRLLTNWIERENTLSSASNNIDAIPTVEVYTDSSKIGH
ncbi:aromatic ring-hydroxylating dioxygenase subunit alpha [Reinekea sp.]|jgi:vanillate O-demethylase monooxygenase subunit|uniref:aromatic ring-hydroxylating dioxygenase subunit alpha n=1 Tax=Reinekea sp. TaxID=1970455 RepID=UPI002A831BA5|nr:aromatic ring-hydroxylating dioxygenase subunit alpha [Reinekea sp.]